MVPKAFEYQFRLGTRDARRESHEISLFLLGLAARAAGIDLGASF